METEPRVRIGKVMRAHGMDGEVQVRVSTDQAETRFRSGTEVWVPTTGEDPEPRRLTVGTTRPHQERLIVQFDQITSRDQAEQLTGKELIVPKDDDSPEDEYFRVHELLDCAISAPPHFTKRPVEELIETGAQPVAVIGLDEDRVLYLPLVEEALVQYESGQQILEVELPSGWEQLVEARS